jgi:hypothetical protein
MLSLEPLDHIPFDIVTDYRTTLIKTDPSPCGVFKVIGIRRTAPGSWESQRIKVLVVDENGFPIPAVRVAYAFSTAPEINYKNLFGDDVLFRWAPPYSPALVVPTSGAGECDVIQNDKIEKGKAGGMTVYVLESDYSSWLVAGAGMLADHSGLCITFMLVRPGVRSLAERISDLEQRMEKLGS